VLLDRAGWVVLKRSFGSDPTAFRGEHDRLAFASGIDVPTPAPIALDAEGRWFGRPALVVTYLPGRTTLHDAPGAWIDELALALGAIHRHPIRGEIPRALRAPHAGLEWRPADPSRLPRTARTERLLDIATAMQASLRAAASDHRLVHHDLYHRNVLWQRGRVSGVVDWNEARLGPPVCDVAYCSVDIAMTAGAATADQLVERYQADVGAIPDVRRWQALWICAQLAWLDLWHAGLRPSQAAHLTMPTIRARLRALADRVITSQDDGD